MTRSFDRRGGYPGGSKPVGPPANISSSSIRPEQMACCHYCGHALTLTKVGMFPRHHPWGSIACEGSGKDPRTASKKEEPVSLDLDCMCSKNDPNCAECWVPDKPALSDFDADVRYRFDECLELLLRKHKDYGPANIANAPGGPPFIDHAERNDRIVR